MMNKKMIAGMLGSGLGNTNRILEVAFLTGFFVVWVLLIDGKADFLKDAMAGNSILRGIAEMVLILSLYLTCIRVYLLALWSDRAGAFERPFSLILMTGFISRIFFEASLYLAPFYVWKHASLFLSITSDKWKLFWVVTGFLYTWYILYKPLDENLANRGFHA